MPTADACCTGHTYAMVCIYYGVNLLYRCFHQVPPTAGCALILTQVRLHHTRWQCTIKTYHPRLQVVAIVSSFRAVQPADFRKAIIYCSLSLELLCCCSTKRSRTAANVGLCLRRASRSGSPRHASKRNNHTRRGDLPSCSGTGRTRQSDADNSCCVRASRTAARQQLPPAALQCYSSVRARRLRRAKRNKHQQLTVLLGSF